MLLCDSWVTTTQHMHSWTLSHTGLTNFALLPFTSHLLHVGSICGYVQMFNYRFRDFAFYWPLQALRYKRTAVTHALFFLNRSLKQQTCFPDSFSMVNNWHKLAAPHLRTGSIFTYFPISWFLSLPWQKAAMFQTHLLNTLSKCLLRMAAARQPWWGPAQGWGSQLLSGRARFHPLLPLLEVLPLLLDGLFQQGHVHPFHTGQYSGFYHRTLTWKYRGSFCRKRKRSRSSAAHRKLPSSSVHFQVAKQP